jgi:uncharacterized protein (TIGR02996 family)
LTIVNSVFRVDGLRLPEFARYLATSTPDNWPFELSLIRSQLFPASSTADSPEEAFLLELRERPRQQDAWMAFGDWLEEQGRGQAGVELLRLGADLLFAPGAGGVPVGADDGRAAEHAAGPAEGRVGGQGLGQAAQGAGGGPAAEAAVHGVPGAEALGQVAPGPAGAGQVQQGRDEGAVGQQRLLAALVPLGLLD